MRRGEREPMINIFNPPQADGVDEVVRVSGDMRVDEKMREGGNDYFFNPPQPKGVDDGGRVDRRGE